MQRTSNFHDSIFGTDDAQTANVFDDTTAFDTAVDMFNADAYGRKQAIECFLNWSQLTAFGVLKGVKQSTSSSAKARKPKSWSKQLPLGSG